MELELKVPFDPELDAIANIQDGKYGVLLAHGSRGDIDKGILPSLSKKLAEKNISSVRFRFPFRQENKNHVDGVGRLDNAYLSTWQYITGKYPKITWLVGGVDIGAETAVRSTGLMLSDSGDIPIVVSLNYPLYPPNRPEKVDASALGAIMGDAIFIQGSESNQGSFDRLRNSIQMMVPHAELKKIRGADHEFKVTEKSFDRIAYWISNDIDRFVKNVFG